MNSTTNIWSALDFKSKIQEEGTNKFLIAEFFNFCMTGNKSVVDQVHELQSIVNKLTSMNIKLLESFQVGAIIAKLPTSSKDCMKKLLCKAEDLSLEQIQKHL